MPPIESKSYDPAATEPRIRAFWEAGGFFTPRPDDRPPEKRFCMVIPPPNVTGALHLGHALNNTLQDILVRQKRMAGFNTLWVVGTDHAGIATQATVEKAIREQEKKSRHDLGREELVRRIWEWKERFGGRIIEQLKLMGCSCDYSRERFTLDEGCAKAVRETFFKMFRDGLIYRGKRLVNWDTQLQTAVADDEVYHEQVKGHFYTFKYPIVGQASLPASAGTEARPTGMEARSTEPTHVHIATTRPETMLADTAVAVHPDPAAAMERAEKAARAKLAECAEKEREAIQAQIEDIAERRKSLLPTLLKLRDMAMGGAGVSPARILLPLVDREIPLICDEWADPTLGTGCVKITPAHDANDYEIGRRHDLPMINMMTPDGRVNENGGKYHGQKLAEARKNVVADLEALELVEKIEDRVIDLGHSDRSKTPIEPYLSDQWFVKMGDLEPEHAAKIEGLRNKAPGLAQMAIDAVKRGSAPSPSKGEGRGEGGEHGQRLRFHPSRYENTYVDWLSEKRDWCISRQLWWGHRIPVWQVDLNMQVVSSTQEAIIEHKRLVGEISSALDKLCKAAQCPDQFSLRSYSGEPNYCFICAETSLADKQILDGLVEIPLNQGILAGLEPIDSRYEAFRELRRNIRSIKLDDDVLDTWFSSALWPHSTLGWPDAEVGGSSALPDGRGSDRTGETPMLPNDHTGRMPVPHNQQSTLDWAGETGETPVPPGQNLLDYYYPTSVLSTAREIITLWVARMVMTGLYNIGEIPFHDVVIHPVIQDGQGRKMSKTLGNGVDPVDIIEEYGADALRFTLAELATETQDIRLPVKPKKLPDGRTINISEKFEKGRNFCNKLWQAATGFVFRNLEGSAGASPSQGYAPKPLDPTALRLEDRWILSRLTAAQADLDEALAKFRTAEAAGVVYRFLWDEYCSWYIEMVKSRVAGQTPPQPSPYQGEGVEPPPLSRTPSSVASQSPCQGEGADQGRDRKGAPGERSTAQQVLVYVLDRLLRMLHPIVPFVTEALWAELNKVAPRRGLSTLFDGEPALVMAAWPSPDAKLRDATVEAQMTALQTIIRSVRDIRADVNDFRGKAKQPSMRTLPSVTVRADAATCALIEKYRGFITPLASCDAIEAGERVLQPHGAMGRVMGGIEVYAPVANYVDLSEVKKSGESKVEELRKMLSRESAKLTSPDFVNRADPGIVAQAKQRAAELSSQVEALERHLAGLS